MRKLVESVSLSPSPLEVAFTVLFLATSVVAVLFAVVAIVMMARGKWGVAHGVALLVVTFIVPFGGPIILAGLGIRNRMGAGRVSPT